MDIEADTGIGIMDGHTIGPQVVKWTPEVLQSPVEGLDLHLRQWEWSSTPDALMAMEGFVKTYKRGRHKRDALYMAQAIERALDTATTTYVDGDVADLLYHQGMAMPPDMLQRTDVPYPVGFMVLAKTWDYMNFDEAAEGNYQDRKIPIRAIAWWETNRITQEDGSFKSGIMLALYADWGFVTSITPLADDTFNQRPRLFMADLWAWTYDTWWKDAAENEDPDQHHASPHVGEMRRVLLTTWRFMQEEIVRTERFKPPRPAARRWARGNIGNIPDDGCITSLHLRRYAKRPGATEAEEREAREVFWSHRWWVSGHYRYCKKCGIDHPRHKHQWVKPYIKGPEDAPLVLKERLVSVDR